jgi:2-polyprenyl-6-methoxyphenol hydroxylase-like FAD-dependent oxidoreductase
MHITIVGAGIGGCTLALSLHEAGFRNIELYEGAQEVRELGVGINVLPHAARELCELGLEPQLNAVAVRTETLGYYNRFGQVLWEEPRGVAAGYRWPQWSIHRGHLLGVLYSAVRARLGSQRIHLGRRLAPQDLDALPGDCVIGADGVHSAVRARLVPNEGPPLWNGVTMWRGVTIAEPFLGGRRMVMAGRLSRRVILYPLRDLPDGRQLINWVVTVRTEDGRPMPRQDWSAETEPAEALAETRGIALDFVDLGALIRNCESVLKYPMADREPLTRWRNGRTTLLGDAAHPMHPNGSNGAAQAILDARVLTRALVRHARTGEPLRALDDYEQERIPATTAVVQANRRAGPERILDLVADRAPDGFARLEDVVSAHELAQIVEDYQRSAGFDPAVLNARPSLAARLDEASPTA